MLPLHNDNGHGHLRRRNFPCWRQHISLSFYWSISHRVVYIVPWPIYIREDPDTSTMILHIVLHDCNALLLSLADEKCSEQNAENMLSNSRNQLIWWSRYVLYKSTSPIKMYVGYKQRQCPLCATYPKLKASKSKISATNQIFQTK